MPHSTTRPRSVTRYDRSLFANCKRVYGYQPVCPCGWEGKVWKTHRESQLERSFHVCVSEPER
jgi:hypothetical protein